jgi:hypothetical protein
MPKRLIVPQPPPRPTPLPGQIVPATKQRVMVTGVGGEPVGQRTQVPPNIRAQEIAQRAQFIPGVQAFAIGDAVKVRISGNSFSEIAQKIAQLPPELVITPSKTICDGEPIRIT